MAYRRFSDGMRLLSVWNISINFSIPFIFNSGGRLWDCKFNKDSPGSRGSIRRRSYIPKTSFVVWALLDR
jgi:hypothetical protein